MDKRKHNRVTLAGKGWRAELNDQVNGKKLGEVVNLSPGGLMLITSIAVEVESLYQVECLTTSPDGQIGRFTAGIMVLWRTGSSQTDTYWAGLQIIDIDLESQERLLALGAAMEADG
jgi:hypothetical protein